MESAKGRSNVRSVLVGLALVPVVYQVVFKRTRSDSSRPVWQSEGDGFETLTNEVEGFENLVQAVSEGECLESKMFEMWNKEAEAEKDMLRRVDLSPELPRDPDEDDDDDDDDEDAFVMDEDRLKALKARLNASLPHFVVAGESAPTPSTKEQEEEDPHRKYCKDPAHKHLAACKLLNHEAWEPVSHSHASHLAHEALRRDARVHMAKEARKARALKAQHTRWDEQAKDKMAELKRQLCADPSRKDYSMCKEETKPHAGDAADIAKHQAAFANEMHDIQVRHDEWDHVAKDQWRELRHKLCADPARQSYPICEHLHGNTSEEVHAELDERMHKLHDQHEAWDHHAQDEIAALKAQLCADPARKGYAACAGKHRESRAEAEGHLDEHVHALHAKHHEWDEHARDEISALMDELCSDPARRGYAACAEHDAANLAKKREPQWSDIQAKLQSQYDSTAAAQQQAARARQVEFDKLDKSTEAQLNSEPEVTGWAQELIKSQSKMRERLEQLHASHSSTSGTSKLRGAKAKESDQTSSWAKGLMAMQAKMQYQLEHLHDHHHHHHADAAASHPSVSSWAQGLLDMQAEMQAQLDHLHDHHRSASQDKTLEPSAWAQGLLDMQAKMQYQLDHLHDHLHSHHSSTTSAPKAKDTTKLRGGARGATSPIVPTVSSSSSAAPLEWHPVKSWKERPPNHGSQAAVLDREKLHSTEWKGQAPNVSCIMALPATTTAQFHLMYAINNFKLVAKHFEGDSELVVVYHHDDEEGAKMVRKYTEEGGRIRGVASRDDAASFPSTMAFRYAAWTSKAQVIAQWDFGTYHHPERLNMQVRALASSARPGSFMVDSGGDGAPAGGVRARGLESTLAGEAAWMRQHWHPQLAEERGVLELAQAHNIVLVDSPAFLYGAGTAATHDTATIEDSSLQQDELELRGVEACRSLSEAGASAEPLDQALSALADEADDFAQLLAKRTDIAAKFGALCREAEAEVDPKKRSFLHHHAGQMDTVRESLDEHFNQVREMLQA